MRVLLSWLKDFIEVSENPIEISNMLTMAGLEVEAIETVHPEIQGVIVVKVKSVQKHPNADKLLIATVFDGNKDYQVVCGDPKCREGLVTAFAPVGAILRDEEGQRFEMKRARLRGVESEGMLCTAKELWINDEDETILTFPPDTELGIEVAPLFGDTVLEVALTPNLGHCASVLGVARELAAVKGVPYATPERELKESEDSLIHDIAKVKVENKEDCPRYACRVLRGIKVAPSPVWLQRRLESAGVRPINNIVDITNYVMLEVGQPLHAFDFDKLSGAGIIVKKGIKGEKFTTLDEKNRTLDGDTLMIADTEKHLAIAGVMGGADSEVSEDTVSVLLESAHFNPRSIRRTSKKLGLQTDSSKRFERGVDPNFIVHALNLAASLMQTLAGAEVIAGVIDVYEKEISSKILECRVSKVNEILGSQLSESEIETVFKRLNFEVEFRDSDVLRIKIPTYRNDISSEIDLIEEVARIYGYDHFHSKHVLFESSLLPHAPIFLFERHVRARLIAEGLQEFLTCDLISPHLISIVEEDVCGEKAIVKILNPTSIEQSVLRPSLLPGLLQLVKHNYDRQVRDVSGFEIGRIHFLDKDQYKEQSMAGIILTGHYRPDHWEHKSQEIDFFDIKGIVENILLSLDIKTTRFIPSNLKTLHPGRQSSIYSDQLLLGTLGEVHPAVLRDLSIPYRVVYAELNLHDLIQRTTNKKIMEPLPQYPKSERDWTLNLTEETTKQEVIDAIHSVESSILEDVSLIDIYRSENLGKGRKNVTFHFTYRSQDKTLSKDEVDTEHARITEEVMRQVGKSLI
ncbi:MAG: phenylalanine--tRNA ligase subunit beta [Chlamydiales bacterium]